MSDRTYWHVPGVRSWHALDQGEDAMWLYTACGRSALNAPRSDPETSDRLPSRAHLCGNCARIIAARTDVEEPPPVDNDAVPA